MTTSKSSNSNRRQETIKLKDLMLEDSLQEFINSKETMLLKSGFINLDKITGGWQKGDFILIGGRPAMGKTAFALSIAKNMAIDFKQTVAIFSLELSNTQLAKRLIVNVTQITADKIQSGQLCQEEQTQFNTRLEEIYEAPIYMDDTPNLSVSELRTKALHLVSEHKVECIIIDYLQLMNAHENNVHSREQEVGIIVRTLKELAKELDIPIIALSQLKRDTEKRSGLERKCPQLSDLRESKEIEKNADIICFIYRPEYYSIYADEVGNDLKGLAEIIVAKNNHGSTGTAQLRFNSEYASFSNMDISSNCKTTRQ